MSDSERCLKASSCHVPILSRLRNPAMCMHTRTCFDSSQWLRLADEMKMFEHSTDTFQYEACQKIFHMMQEATQVIQSVTAVSNLLKSYSQLLTVASSNQDGFEVTAPLLCPSVQLKLIDEARLAWDMCIASSLPGDKNQNVRLGQIQQVASEGLQHSALYPLPVEITSLGRVHTSLNLAKHLLNIANLAVISDHSSATQAQGIIRLRREPSFAQLAGKGLGSTVRHHEL